MHVVQNTDLYSSGMDWANKSQSRVWNTPTHDFARTTLGAMVLSGRLMHMGSISRGNNMVHLTNAKVKARKIMDTCWGLLTMDAKMKW